MTVPFASDLPRTADLVVIGGGIVGAATAFHASRAGLDVVVLERKPALCSLHHGRRGRRVPPPARRRGGVSADR